MDLVFNHRPCSEDERTACRRQFFLPHRLVREWVGNWQLWWTHQLAIPVHGLELVPEHELRDETKIATVGHNHCLHEKAHELEPLHVGVRGSAELEHPRNFDSGCPAFACCRSESQ